MCSFLERLKRVIDYQTLKSWRFSDVEHTYTADDSMLYALAVGFGVAPMDERQLRFVNDANGCELRVAPTMSVILGYPGPWMSDARTGIDYSALVHGEESIVVHKPLTPASTIVAKHRVVRVVDKGHGKGATVTYDKELFDKASGEKLATVTHTTFCRREGGFSSVRGQKTDTSPPRPIRPPQRSPDAVLEMRTLPQQALLYRLCGDRNPLHSTPVVARNAGFDRPILHGLATFGFAGHAVLASWCDYDPARLKALSARFTAPTYPGETLGIEMYKNDRTVSFRVVARERGAIVMDYGQAELS
jgi:acyl dehydratase